MGTRVTRANAGFTRTLRLTRPVWGLAAVALTLAIMPGSRAATQSLRVIGHLPIFAPEDAQTEDADRLAGSMIVNPAARRAYQLFRTEFKVETQVVAIDLDTLRPVGRLRLPYRIATRVSSSAEYIYALDPDTNTLYFPYVAGTLQSFSGVLVVDGTSLRLRHNLDRTNATDPTQVVGGAPPSVPPAVCTSVNCRQVLAGVSPIIDGIDFTPPYLSGGPAKILMMWHEPNAPGGELNSNIMWIAQWDAVNGHEDFAYRVTSCQQRGLPNTTSSTYALALFQARLGSGIYFGCNASGGTGQVVRITLDNTYQPSAEDAFPGPTNVADVIADRDDDRLIFRVDNEEGESYWVFNGAASSYSGVVGGTVDAASTGLGIDHDSGRLYVLAPPTQRGRQSSTGGILMSDIRRSPAPQALVFPEFASKGFFPISVDSRAPNGTRRVFVRPFGAVDYTILEDDVPVTTDAPLTDLDRFTTDVDEEAGRTDVNFTGTAHTYGLRSLLIAGAEGVPPGGPDASGVRVGRFVPRYAGSPCYGSDRELIVGAVQNAQLSNNLTSAASSAGQTDPGTKTDLGQPIQRCYPHPQYDAGTGSADPFAPLYPYTPDHQYPRPLDVDTDNDGKPDPGDQDGTSDADEVSGTAWPFGVAQCASEGKDSSSTSSKPLDRGENIPADQRRTEVPLPGYSAKVTCALSKNIVDANADAAAIEQSVSGLGLIRIGDVSSYTNLYRDPHRGLVVRSVAFVRGINIADRVFIDTAFTYAEAWAAGRPGTAATSFIRRLCGVRIPEAKIHADIVDLNTDPAHGPDAVGDVDPLDDTTDDQTVSGVDAEGCGDVSRSASALASQGQQPVVDAVNKVLGSRGRVSVPQPDSELRQGSPGGYLASIQKDRLQQISARSVNNDDTSEVPALEILLFNDDPTKGRGRQLIQLAGVDASVTYGIYLLNPETGELDIGPREFGFRDPPPALPEEFDEGNDDEHGSMPPVRGGPITVLFAGANFLLRRPKDALLAAAVWAMLFAPVQLMIRRRALKAMR